MNCKQGLLAINHAIKIQVFYYQVHACPGMHDTERSSNMGQCHFENGKFRLRFLMTFSLHLGNGTTVPCPANTYSQYGKSIKCVPCPLYHVTNGLGAASLKDCTCKSFISIGHLTCKYMKTSSVYPKEIYLFKEKIFGIWYASSLHPCSFGLSLSPRELQILIWLCNLPSLCDSTRHQGIIILRGLSYKTKWLKCHSSKF